MNYAPFKMRVLAFLLDYLLILSYGIFVVGSVSLLFRQPLNFLFSNSPVIAQITGFVMMTAPVSLYFILSECSKWKGTWGKRKMSLQVVNDQGDRLGLSRSLIRTAIKFLPWEVAHFAIWRLMLPTSYSEKTLYIVLNTVNVAILLYLIVPFTNKKRRNIYDWLAGTAVVEKEDESS
ncbi:RDD family protein [Halobacillus litoralis]|uniref:RDD family protein n=1 Tax=Halobacillus litoralis TaxID=45668 RepID=A0A410MBH7_9BACI|nr:RDD family protein [Halobacillus litoralis]QAS52057.1 RDD family protein [Halobacillus litoralis]